MRSALWLAGALALPAAWFAAHFTGAVDGPVQIAFASGAAIFGAGFLLSWTAEVAQLDVPRALALAVLALIAVLPEYAVDVYFAWRAGQDPAYTAYATANMTGGNRLLIGVGWAASVLTIWLRHRRRAISLPREQAVEINYLALATAYSFLMPLKGTLSILDTVVLLAVFLAYMLAAGRSHHEEPTLEGPSELIARTGKIGRRAATLGIMALAGGAIYTAAEPFAESLLAVGRTFHIEEFLLVQWLAPLVSESPEFIVAVLFALRGAAAASIGTLISSTVNQWTLLVGALPAAFALSHGGLAPMVLDRRQREEIFLTSAQSVFAPVVISNFRFTHREALALTSGCGSSTKKSRAARCGSSATSRLVAAVKAAIPASWSRTVASSGARPCVHSVTSASRSSSWRLRATSVAKRASSASSGRPRQRANRAHAASSSIATAIQRSSPAARKMPWGAMCGSRLPSRGGATPFIVHETMASGRTVIEDSHCERSMYCPSPVRARWSRAARMATAPWRPPVGSPYEMPTCIGGQPR